jgi:hypothetical protein
VGAGATPLGTRIEEARRTEPPVRPSHCRSSSDVAVLRTRYIGRTVPVIESLGYVSVLTGDQALIENSTAECEIAGTVCGISVARQQQPVNAAPWI